MAVKSTLKKVKRFLRGGCVPIYYSLRSRAVQCFKLKRLPFLPHKIDIEPIDMCNFTCDHCQVTHWNRLTTRLTPERFKTILTQLPGLLSIKLQGMGEPLLNKLLIDMLEECERRGIDMEVTSNGSVYTENIASRLSSLRRALIVFSIDGATAETFEAIRVKGNFKAVTSHVADFTRRRGKKPWPRIEIRTVATLRNIHELPDIVRLAKRLGVDSLTITTLLTDWGKAEMQDSLAPINVSRENSHTDQFIEEAEKVADTINMPIIIEHGQRYSTLNRCIWPWYSSYIAANGDVVPCCIIADSTVAKMGNLFEEPFSRIWNNEKYQDLRRRISSNDIPHYCRNCYGMTPIAPANER